MGIIEKLKKFRDTPVVIFGTSREGRTANKIFASYNAVPVCFIDNNKLKIMHGGEDGVPVYSPDHLYEMDDFIVVVPSAYYKEMFAQLMDMKILRNRIYNIEIYEETMMCLFDAPYKLRAYMLLNKYFPRR